MIKHYPSCNSNYPEKPRGEAPRSTTGIDLGEETVRTCNDCGAHELVRTKGRLKVDDIAYQPPEVVRRLLLDDDPTKQEPK